MGYKTTPLIRPLFTWPDSGLISGVHCITLLQVYCKVYSNPERECSPFIANVVTANPPFSLPFSPTTTKEVITNIRAPR